MKALVLAAPLLPPPCLIDGGAAYTVTCLLQACCWRRGLQYLTNWKGYGPEERPWDLVHHILNITLIGNFELQHPEQVAGLPYLAGTNMSTLSFTPPELPICLVEDALWDVRSHPLGVFCHNLLQLNQPNPLNQCICSSTQSGTSVLSPGI